MTTNHEDGDVGRNRSHRDSDPTLPTDLAILFESIRQEFDAKVSSLKAWGAAAMLGGGTIGGFIGAYFHQDVPRSVTSALAGLIGF